MAERGTGADGAGAQDGIEQLRAAVAAAERTGQPLLPPPPGRFLIEGVDAAAAGDYGSQLESICGVTDDSQPVETYDGTLGVTQDFVAAHQATVACVRWNADLSAYTNPGNVAGARFGTGTMISRDLFITAGHLFDQTGGGWMRPADNATGLTISPQEIATNMHLEFNYQDDSSGNPRPITEFAITALLEHRLGGVDYAICRIAGDPGDTFGAAAVSATDAAVGDMLAIMGHPLGVPKRIEAGPATELTGIQIRYNDIDTQGGNSGSGIWQASTGALVGVHTNGGCNASGTGSNFGMRVSSILDNSPVLRDLVLDRSWVARHGLTGAGYQSEFDRLVRLGYRLADVSGYGLAGADFYAAIWRHEAGPAWVARHGLTSAEYQQAFDQLVGQGFRPRVVSGYEAGGTDRYAALFDNAPSPGWAARHGLTSAQYQQAFDELVAQGFRLVHVNGYGVGGSDRYAAIWEQSAGPAWVARHGLTSAQYQQAFDELVAQGFRLVHVSGYEAGGSDRYAAIWEQSAGPEWVARHGLTSAEYQKAFDELVGQGFRLRHVSGYGIGGVDHYAAIWERG
jgi:V8-like Glu-specific endopeptidase